MVIRVLR